MKLFEKMVSVVLGLLLIVVFLVSCSTMPASKESESRPVSESGFLSNNQDVTDTQSVTEEEQFITISNALWPERSLEELVTDAELIVRAKYVGHDPSYRNEEGTDRHVYTDHRFEVLESYKGDRKVGDEVVVKCYGGEFEGQLYVSEDQTQFKDDQEYIMILTHETDGNDVPTENDKYWHYPPKGILTLGEDGKYTAIDPSVSFTAEEFRSEVEKILG